MLQQVVVVVVDIIYIGLNCIERQYIRLCGGANWPVECDRPNYRKI